MSDLAVPTNKSDWDELVGDLKNKHARRMNDLLDDLPDKQFRIVYPKLLEFCIPKMQRQEIIKETNNNMNILQIQVVQSPEQIEEYKRAEAIDVFDISADQSTNQ